LRSIFYGIDKSELWFTNKLKEAFWVKLAFVLYFHLARRESLAVSFQIKNVCTKNSETSNENALFGRVQNNTKIV